MLSISKSVVSYNIPKKVLQIIIITPIIMTLCFLIFIINPATKSFGFWLVSENRPIEIFTFIFLIIGGLFGAYNSFKLRKYLESGPLIFYGIFSFFLIIVAMEEIAWGQWFFHFETPTEWAKMNRQGETTLHNLEIMGGHNEILRIIFGLGGIIGVVLRNHPKIKKIGAPKILASWFLIIVFMGFIDFMEGEGWIQISDNYVHEIRSTSELVELLIGISSFLYLFLNFRYLKQLIKTQ
ncbi:hypothetical protein [Flavivirga jejuensis]|uniref:Uncharacterized protein n=1 Tax=Flavivirga jejuensis TaxID=870487 RepID=A0ABT8WSA3_9FLAO|nr:hypothetical protein [Flavivirga jejuensis]MDO5975849.1 hypothetical protein [Flavivirga jejuensis]